MPEINSDNVHGSMLHLVNTGHKLDELVFITAPRAHLPFEVATLLQGLKIKVKRDDGVPKGVYYMITKEDYKKYDQNNS